MSEPRLHIPINENPPFSRWTRHSALCGAKVRYQDFAAIPARATCKRCAEALANRLGKLSLGDGR